MATAGYFSTANQQTEKEHEESEPKVQVTAEGGSPELVASESDSDEHMLFA